MHTRKSVQVIPGKIISKSNHKYIYRKTLINTKFQWLNKYLSTTELKPLSIKNTQHSSHKSRHNSSSNLINQKGFSKNKQKHLKTQIQQNQNSACLEDYLIDMSNSFQLLKQVNINTQTLKERSKDSNVLVMVRDLQGNLQQKFQKQRKKILNSNKNTQNFFNSSKKQLSPHRMTKGKVGNNFQNTPPCLANRNTSNLTQMKQTKKKRLFMKTPQSQLSYIFRKRKNFEDFKVEPWKLDNEQQDEFTKF